VRETKTILFLRVSLGAGALACVFLASPPPAVPSEGEPDPCAHAFGPDLNPCWAREAQHANDEMQEVVQALREKLPKRASKSLEKAQKHWLEFRDAHLQTLYGVESPTKTWGLDYPICLSMSRVALTRARTRELLRILEPDEEALCPL
jgi:uncharacterized protein YecT (DUF1311 family)